MSLNCSSSFCVNVLVKGACAMASSHTCAAVPGSLDLHLLVSPGMQQLASVPRPMIIMRCVLFVCCNATIFQSVLFLSVTCVPLAHETPPTALILDAPSGGPLPLLPQEPSPPADGVTLKAPQVGTPSSVFSRPMVLRV